MRDQESIDSQSLTPFDATLIIHLMACFLLSLPSSTTCSASTSSKFRSKVPAVYVIAQAPQLRIEQAVCLANVAWVPVPPSPRMDVLTTPISRNTSSTSPVLLRLYPQLRQGARTASHGISGAFTLWLRHP